jgi:hypothetical protein
MSSEYDFITYLKSQDTSDENTNIIKYLQNQIKFKQQTEHYKDKIKVSMSLIKFIETMCPINTNVTIFGSFTRNLLEKIFMSSDEKGFGNPINHDIDLTVFDNINNYTRETDNFNDMISLFKIIANNDNFDFNFYGYKIIDISDKTLRHSDLNEFAGFGKKFMLNVPHFVIILKKDNVLIKYDLLGYKVVHNQNNWQNEYNTNSLSITSNGIIANNPNKEKSYNFFNILHSVLEREVVCNIPFEKILYNFLTKFRGEKIQILNQIIWFMTNRTKILSLGYNKISSDFKFLDYIVEKTEPCELTGNSAPYIKIKLECEHYISLMGLIGITNIKASDWTEAIKCPYCRADINIKLIEIKPTEIQVPCEPKKDLLLLEDYEINTIINSTDNQNYISHVLNKNQVPTNVFVNSETEANIITNTYIASSRRSREEYFSIVQNTINHNDSWEDYTDRREISWGPP